MIQPFRSDQSKQRTSHVTFSLWRHVTSSTSSSLVEAESSISVSSQWRRQRKIWMGSAYIVPAFCCDHKLFRVPSHTGNQAVGSIQQKEDFLDNAGNLSAQFFLFLGSRRYYLLNSKKETFYLKLTNNHLTYILYISSRDSSCWCDNSV